jgi:hypothetical protein
MTTPKLPEQVEAAITEVWNAIFDFALDKGDPEWRDLCADDRCPQVDALRAAIAQAIADAERAAIERCAKRCLQLRDVYNSNDWNAAVSGCAGHVRAMLPANETRVTEHHEEEPK